MVKTTTPTPSENLDGLDRASKAGAAALEALRRKHEAAFDGFALQKQLADERFQASPERKAKYAAWQEAMERGEPTALDYGPEIEEAERWACEEISRRAGAEAGFELVREPGVTYVRAARARPRGGRSPRPATNGKRRGSRRSSVRRSSERSGDSGEDGEPSERTCECDPECGLDISHRAPQARYLNDTHAAYARQKRKRALSRDWSADVSRADAYLRHEPEEVARARRRVEEGCRCNGHHIPDPSDGHCLKCGHDRPYGPVFAGFIAARSVESRRPRRPELFA